MIDPNDPGTLDLIAACEEPMSGAERARRHRLKKKQTGVKEFSLTPVDLGRLFIALDTHLSFNQLLDWDLQAYRELATRLFKGEAHGAAWVQALGTSEGVANLQKQRGQDAKRGWDACSVERKLNADMKQKLLQGQEEIKRLQAALQQIAAEVGADPSALAAPPTPAAKVDRVEVLLRRVKVLEEQNAREVADRGKAFDAVAVLQARLQKAGLVHDYRRQPGE